MSFIDTLIVNIIYITFPVLCYLFYVSHNENFSKKNNELFLPIKDQLHQDNFRNRTVFIDIFMYENG